MAHATKTLMGDDVLFVRKGDTLQHVAKVIKVHSDHVADLVCYCPVSHQWFEASSVQFGADAGRDYFINTPETN